MCRTVQSIVLRPSSLNPFRMSTRRVTGVVSTLLTAGTSSSDMKSPRRRLRRWGRLLGQQLWIVFVRGGGRRHRCHCMNSSLYARREVGTEVKVAAGSGGLAAAGLQVMSREQSVVYFTDANGTCPRFLVECDKATRGPGRPPMGDGRSQSILPVRPARFAAAVTPRRSAVASC